jgi:hypothetical protein
MIAKDISKSGILLAHLSEYDIIYIMITSGTENIGLGISSPQVALEQAAGFIYQIAEEGYGAKRSCALTAQLNAHVALGVIDTDTALTVQEDVSSDLQYDHYWGAPQNGPDQEWRAWICSPFVLQTILRHEYDIDAPEPHVVSERQSQGPVTMPRVGQHLLEGSVVMLSGWSTVARHARTAFEPAETPGKLFVHDPHYPETTGIYDYASLHEFQANTRAIVY